MIEVRLKNYAGDFAGDKDIARDLREMLLRPAVRAGEPITIDFAGVDLATQSFIHALVSDLVKFKRFDALELLTFANCNPSVKELIEIVVEYSQEDVTET